MGVLTSNVKYKRGNISAYFLLLAIFTRSSILEQATKHCKAIQ